MPNVLDESAAELFDALSSDAGHEGLSLVQGATRLDGLTAVLSRQQYEVTDAEGFPLRVIMHDWTFRTEDLGGLSIRNGAEIREVVDGVEQVYEAMPVGNMPAVVPLDANGVLTKVHTKKVELDV